MATNLDISIIIKAIDRASKPFQVIERATSRYAKQVDELNSKMQKASKTMKDFGTKASLGVSLPLLGIGAAAVATSAKFEQLKTDFEIMLGSADKATKLFEKVKQFSASTPFQLDGLAENTKKLLAFGIEENNVLTVMRKLGDTAGGNSQKLGTLVDVYGKVAAGGKASMEDINRVTDAGVPILKVLAKQLGVTVTTLREDLIPGGKVTQEVFDKAFTSMTEKGGMFYQGMAKQSQTLNGLLSTFKDNAMNALGTLGETITKTFDLKGQLTSIINFMNKLNGFIEKHPKLVKMVVVFGAFLAITGPLIIGLGLVTSSLGSIIAFAPRFMFFMGIIKKMTAAQWLLNIALNANPVGLIVVGFLALITIGAVLYKHWKPLAAFFKGVWIGLKDGLKPVMPLLNTVDNLIKGIWSWFSKLITPINTAGKASESFGIKVGKAISSVLLPVMTLIQAMDKVGKFLTGGKKVPVAESAGAVPKFDVGSTGITRTGLAIVHQGEKIIPAGMRAGGSTINFTPTLNFNGVSAGEARQVAGVMKSELEKMIKDIMHDQGRRAFA